MQGGRPGQTHQIDLQPVQPPERERVRRHALQCEPVAAHPGKIPRKRKGRHIRRHVRRRQAQRHPAPQRRRQCHVKPQEFRAQDTLDIEAEAERLRPGQLVGRGQQRQHPPVERTGQPPEQPRRLRHVATRHQRVREFGHMQGTGGPGRHHPGPIAPHDGAGADEARHVDRAHVLLQHRERRQVERGLARVGDGCARLLSGGRLRHLQQRVAVAGQREHAQQFGHRGRIDPSGQQVAQLSAAGRQRRRRLTPPAHSHRTPGQVEPDGAVGPQQRIERRAGQAMVVRPRQRGRQQLCPQQRHVAEGTGRRAILHQRGQRTPPLLRPARRPSDSRPPTQSRCHGGAPASSNARFWHPVRPATPVA